MPKARVKMKTVQAPDGSWSVTIVGMDPDIPFHPKSAKKDGDGLELTFHNITGTGEDPGGPRNAPKILLSFKTCYVRNAFESPGPDDIVKDQPYKLKSGEKEEFELREHLGLTTKGANPRDDDNTYEIDFTATPDPDGIVVNTAGGPGDGDVLIEC